jgi:hypothetical protein
MELRFTIRQRLKVLLMTPKEFSKRAWTQSCLYKYDLAYTPVMWGYFTATPRRMERRLLESLGKTKAVHHQWRYRPLYLTSYLWRSD